MAGCAWEGVELLSRALLCVGDFFGVRAPLHGGRDRLRRLSSYIQCFSRSPVGDRDSRVRGNSWWGGDRPEGGVWGSCSTTTAPPPLRRLFRCWERGGTPLNSTRGDWAGP